MAAQQFLQLPDTGVARMAGTKKEIEDCRGPASSLTPTSFSTRWAGEGPHRQPVRISCKPLATADYEAVTNTEVLQEILHVRARRLGIKGRSRRGSRCQRSGARGSPGQTRRCPGGVQGFSNDITVLGARDALHAAVMKNGSLPSPPGSPSTATSPC